MVTVCLSSAVKKGIVATLITGDGKLLFSKTEKITDSNVTNSTFLSIINSVKLSLKCLSLYLDTNKEVEEVVIECNNSTLIKWINQGYARDEYQNEFLEMMKFLDKLPIKFNFMYSKKPKACLFTDEKYIVKEKYSKLDV